MMCAQPLSSSLPLPSPVLTSSSLTVGSASSLQRPSTRNAMQPTMSGASVAHCKPACAPRLAMNSVDTGARFFG
eukprot:8923843-Pyramimonas_sp.AAC.1